MVKGEGGGGRGEESVVANKRAKLRQLNANGEMGGGGWGVGWVIRIQQSLRASYRKPSQTRPRF